MKFKDLLLQLQVPPVSNDIQQVRGHRHHQLTLLTTFGFPTTSAKLLQKLRKGLSADWHRNYPGETLNDIYAVKYLVQEMMTLRAKVLEQEGGQK